MLKVDEYALANATCVLRGSFYNRASRPPQLLQQGAFVP